MVGHVDEPVDPEISFSDGGLIGGQVAVDDQQVGSGGNGIGDEPFEAEGGIAKVSVFVQVEIAGVADLERHWNSCKVSEREGGSECAGGGFKHKRADWQAYAICT